MGNKTKELAVFDAIMWAVEQHHGKTEDAELMKGIESIRVILGREDKIKALLESADILVEKYESDFEEWKEFERRFEEVTDEE